MAGVDELEEECACCGGASDGSRDERRGGSTCDSARAYVLRASYGTSYGCSQAAGVDGQADCVLGAYSVGELIVEALYLCTLPCEP